MNKQKCKVAFCSIGVLGIITSNGLNEVTYADGNKGEAYTGFVIHDTVIEGIKGDSGKLIFVKTGDQWTSKNPNIIGEVEIDLDSSLNNIIKNTFNQLSHIIK